MRWRIYKFGFSSYDVKVSKLIELTNLIAEVITGLIIKSCNFYNYEVYVHLNISHWRTNITCVFVLNRGGNSYSMENIWYKAKVAKSLCIQLSTLQNLRIFLHWWISWAVPFKVNIRSHRKYKELWTVLNPFVPEGSLKTYLYLHAVNFCLHSKWKKLGQKAGFLLSTES